MKLYKCITSLAFATLFTAPAFSQQLDLSAEIRPRYERRQGFGKLFRENDKVANFVSQRTRLNIGYQSERINVKITLQNIRTWGDVGTMARDDQAMALHEAWAEGVFLSGKIVLKMGRQEIVYDDHRIFGSVDWAQQARSHDAFLIKFIPNKSHRVDVGLALNATGENSTRQPYSRASYKTFQYAWYHGKFNDWGLSFLFLNTGAERANSLDIDYMQTIGPRLTYQNNKFKADASTYMQVGRHNNRDVNALDFSIHASYKIWEGLSIGLGYEYLSGKSQSSTDNKVTSFKPLFGTNHKFNGLMDYFYVGNHNESVGLHDPNITIAYTKNKFFVKVVPHLFFAAADVYDGTTKKEGSLGTEIDIVAGYKIIKSLSVNAGFSSMLATETMEVLKEGGDRNEANNWTWVMITFKPTLFSWKKKNPR